MDAYWIIGPGRIGLSLGSVLADAGASDLLLVGRRERAPDHPVIDLPAVRYAGRLTGPPPDGTCLLLAVPDGAIAELAAQVARLGPPGAGCTALHHSGAQPAALLAPLARRGYATGSLHPLQTVADPLQGAERLRGAFYTYEGDGTARQAAARIVAAAAGRMLEVHAEDKARYHAACVFASNYVVACVSVATRLLGDAVSVGRAEAAQALQPLWHGALANLERPGLPRALTGPVARGDLETVRRHLESLPDGTRELYGRLALEALELSREQGLAEGTAAAIEAEIRSWLNGEAGPL
ncbi:MAG: DUF2520 domain-containing protein [Gemmatimonadales bacterium]|jgi:predicted short-subunit dehydrogenase-like oxidoreductase (DUF2520 family)